MIRYLTALTLAFSMPLMADCVVLLHGLARTPTSMEPIADLLDKSGYQVINQGYPSRKQSIENLASATLPQALSACPKQHKIHFVTHSMGAILLRSYLNNRQIPHLGRTVMLGPPNQGSEIVDELKHLPGFELINGPAGLQLSTSEKELIYKLGPVNFDVGVIAGSQSVNLILSSIIPGSDDGKVSIERTRITGMNDHLVLPVSHPLMMHNRQVQQQTLHYLKYGYFESDSD